MPARPTPEPPRFTRERLEGLIERMRAQRVVVLGDAMLDIYLTGDADRISPEAPVPVVTVAHRRYALGGAGNVAANVAAIGAECRLIAGAGDDTRGDQLRAELLRANLNGKFVVTTAGRPTTAKTRVMARGQQIVRIDEEVDDPLSPSDLEKLAQALRTGLADADALILEDYNKGVLEPPLIQESLVLARRRGIPVVVDPKYKNFFAYGGATVFKPNRRELEQAMGAAMDLDHPDALPQAVDRLAVDNLLLTVGAQGMALVTKDKSLIRIPTMAREVYDVSGAGDTVTAWMGTALAAGASVIEAAYLANYAAGIEVSKAGVATVSPAEVLEVHEQYYDQLGKLRRGGLL
jgi:D-glycero-beta-D-manno-heptose-7-phosphate kinase